MATKIRKRNELPILFSKKIKKYFFITKVWDINAGLHFVNAKLNFTNMKLNFSSAKLNFSSAKLSFTDVMFYNCHRKRCRPSAGNVAEGRQCLLYV